jgi:hypothetical protein
MLQVVIVILFGITLIRMFLARGMPQVGGKIGSRHKVAESTPVPDGFSKVYARSMRLFVASGDAAKFPDRKSFLRQSTQAIPALMHVYRVAGCKTEIEIPAGRPDYDRIDAGEALALLRELPDPRLVRRLHLSDQPAFLDPWVRKVTGRDVRLLGHATDFGLIALYRPDRNFPRENGLTLLHEWLHIVAFKHEIDLWRFRRAGKIEPLAPIPYDGINTGRAARLPHEAWADLGEKLLGYDEEGARREALASPIHATILWRRIEKILRKTAVRLRSTRFVEFEARTAFMRGEVAAKARESRLRRSSPS